MVFKALREVRIESSRMSANFSLFRKQISQIPWEANVFLQGSSKRCQTFKYSTLQVQEQEKCACSKRVVQPEKEIIIEL